MKIDQAELEQFRKAYIAAAVDRVRAAGKAERLHRAGGRFASRDIKEACARGDFSRAAWVSGHGKEAA